MGCSVFSCQLLWTEEKKRPCTQLLHTLNSYFHTKTKREDRTIKEYSLQIRIISVEHELTTETANLVKSTMEKHGLHYPVLNVYCHLEAGRCGIPSGRVAVEVDGSIIWSGERITRKLAEQFCTGLKVFIQKQKENYSGV